MILEYEAKTTIYLGDDGWYVRVTEGFVGQSMQSTPYGPVEFDHVWELQKSLLDNRKVMMANVQMNIDREAQEIKHTRVLLVCPYGHNSEFIVKNVPTGDSRLSKQRVYCNTCHRVFVIKIQTVDIHGFDPWSPLAGRTSFKEIYQESDDIDAVPWHGDHLDFITVKDA